MRRPSARVKRAVLATAAGRAASSAPCGCPRPRADAPRHAGCVRPDSGMWARSRGAC